MLNPKGYLQVPLDPKLIAWFSADKINNVNTPLPADAANLANWFDISGKGSIPAQATVANQPVFNTNVANGKPAVTFNSDTGGANGDSFSTNNAAFLNNVNIPATADGFTIFVVAQIAALSPPSGGSGSLVFLQGSNPSGNAVYEVTQSTSGNIVNTVTNNSSTQTSITSGSAVVNTPFINTFYWDKANSVTRAQFNSNAEVTGVGSVPELNGVPTLFTIGRQKNSQPTRHFDGKIFEILIYARLLSSAQRAVIKQYLASKYAITL